MGFYITDQTQDRGPRAAAPLWAPKPARGPILEVISGYRFYNPSLGRWVNRDPIGEKAFKKLAVPDISITERGKKLYTFVTNNTVNKSEFLGLVGLIKWIRCYYKMKKWEKNCKEEVPTQRECVDLLPDTAAVVACGQRRKRLLRKCLANSAEMFKRCIKACVPSKPGL